MAKKAYPLRINAKILEAMQRWADDDLRSVNAQIEFVLRDALCRAGRLRSRPSEPVVIDEPDESSPPGTSNQKKE